MACFNVKLLPLKLLLFTFYGALGCLVPFLTIHMRHIGLELSEITWINTALPVASLLGPPLVAMLADRCGHYRPITIVCMLAGAILHTALLFVPPSNPVTAVPSSLHLECHNNGSALVLDHCGHICPSHAHFLVSSFRVWGCEWVCDSNELPPNLVSFAENSSLVSPVEAESLVSVPQLMLMSISGEKELISLTGEIVLEFNRSVGHGISRGVGRGCGYPQEEFNMETGPYMALTCPGGTPQCHVVCDASEEVNGTHLLQLADCSPSKRDDNSHLTFWLYFGLRSMAEMCNAILVSLLDAVALTMVAQHGGDYGREKMCGLLAIGIFAPLCGLLVDTEIGVFGSYDYGPVFYVFDALMIVTAIVTLMLPIQVQVHRTGLISNISTLVRTSEISALLLLLSLLGVFWGYLKTFVYVYLEDLGGSKLLLGLTISCSILPSLPFLYRSAAVVQFCGHHYLIMLAFVSYCVRFTGLSYISDPWWSLPLESLELFSVNLMQVSAATLAYKLAPKALVATAQALLWVSHFNIGRCIGTFVGGYLYHEYGGVMVFQYCAALAASIAAIYLAVYQLIQRRQSIRSRQPKPAPTMSNGRSGIANGDYAPLQVVADDRF